MLRFNRRHQAEKQAGNGSGLTRASTAKLARSLDESIGRLGLTVLRSPPHSPKANAICERVIGTIRREWEPIPPVTHSSRHRIGKHVGVLANPVPGGLHHECLLAMNPFAVMCGERFTGVTA